MPFGSVPLGLLLMVSAYFLAVSSQEDLSFSLSDELYAYAEKKYLFQNCEANLELTHIRWLNPKNIHIGTTGRIYVEGSPKDKKLILIFKGIEHGDEGNYTCVATLPNDEIVSKTFKLKVLKPITFVNTSEFQSASEGSNGFIQCNVEGDPAPTIIWKPKSTEWIGHDRYRIIGEKFSINNVTREDAGEYRCTALQHNEEKSDFREIIIKFVVKYKPEWKPYLNDKVYSYITGIVNLTCEAHGVPTPVFSWIRHDKPVVVEPAGQYVITNSEGKSTLEVFIHNESSFGSYICEARNEMGTIEHEIELKLGVRPSMPAVIIKEYQPSSVELDITTEKESELNLFSYRVQYKENGQQWTAAKFVTFEVGSAYVIEGLKENTDYVLRAAAENVAGLSNYTEDISFRTVNMKNDEISDNRALSLRITQRMDVMLNCIFAVATFAVAYMV